MPRFRVNDYVQMRDVILSSRRGQVGQITDVKPNKRQKQTLDRYSVRFPDATIVEVWDIQLAGVENHEFNAGI